MLILRGRSEPHIRQGDGKVERAHPVFMASEPELTHVRASTATAYVQRNTAIRRCHGHHHRICLGQLDQSDIQRKRTFQIDRLDHTQRITRPHAELRVRAARHKLTRTVLARVGVARDTHSGDRRRMRAWHRCITT